MSGWLLRERRSGPRTNKHEEHHEERDGRQGPADTDWAVYYLVAAIRIPGRDPTAFELAVGDDQGDPAHQRQAQALAQAQAHAQLQPERR